MTLLGGLYSWIAIFVLQFELIFTGLSLKMVTKLYKAGRFALTGPLILYPIVYICYIMSLLTDGLNDVKSEPTFDDVYFSFVGYLFITSSLMILQIRYLPNIRSYLTLLEEEAAKANSPLIF